MLFCFFVLLHNGVFGATPDILFHPSGVAPDEAVKSQRAVLSGNHINNS